MLEVYQRPYAPQRPVVCLDETSKQLTGEVRTPVPAANNTITFGITGPGRIIGVGNGDPSCHEPNPVAWSCSTTSDYGVLDLATYDGKRRGNIRA